MKQPAFTLLFYFVFVALVSCAPKSRNDKLTTYDQKQTGDYNIQLHLKDFQIVALLSEDSLGAFGDYEYNYDYSDLTVKPHNSTTAKPLEQPSSSTAITSESPLSSEKPEIPSPTSFAAKPSSSTPVPSTTTQKIPETSSLYLENSTLDKNSTSSKNVRSESLPATSSDSERLGEKVQKATSITILPLQISTTSESSNINGNVLNLGEILHYRRCPSGYSRDKRGRCRRTKRPGVLPYGITRLASNLAANFRKAVSDEESAEESSEE